MAERWTADHIPDQTGRVAIVTGANSGLGLETVRGLARKGARVVLACRDLAKAQDAIATLAADDPGASLEALELDLANQKSIRAFAAGFLERHDALHVLCNNAGVMALPLRRTAEGFEMQMGTNHLGHFALVGLLLERLLATRGARVVTVSSTFHRLGRIRFDDLQSERRYSRWGAYGQSKLANLLFAFELQRRIDAAGAGLLSLASHPGYAATNLQTAGARMENASWREAVFGLGNRILAQSSAMGALPSLFAATAPDVRGGEYYGPDGILELAGHPTRAGASARARDPETARRLWQISEELTDVRYTPLAS